MIKIITGGIYTRHNANFCINRPQGFPHYVLFLIKSQARLTISGKKYKIMPDSALIICPDTPYYYDNPEGNYMHDWLHFEVLNDKSTDTNISTGYVSTGSFENLVDISDFLPFYLSRCPIIHFL